MYHLFSGILDPIHFVSEGHPFSNVHIVCKQITNIWSSHILFNHYYQESVGQNQYTPLVSPRSFNCCTRIRIGHSHLSHKYLMQKESPPDCIFCNTNCSLTIKHIIENCTYFTSNRIAENITSVKLASGDNPNGNKQVLKYLNICNLYDLI